MRRLPYLSSSCDVDMIPVSRWGEAEGGRPRWAAEQPGSDPTCERPRLSSAAHAVNGERPAREGRRGSRACLFPPTLQLGRSTDGLPRARGAPAAVDQLGGESPDSPDENAPASRWLPSFFLRTPPPALRELFDREHRATSSHLPFYSQTAVLRPKINQPDERPEKAKLHSFVLSFFSYGT